MTAIDPRFHKFTKAIESYQLPKRFTFPFYYTPHPLCKLASEELQEHISRQENWKHNFGLEPNQEDPIGKMFGVLLVKTKHGEIGYLAAFSGKMAGVNHLPGFVPPVYDMLAEDSFFIKGKKVLNSINAKVEQLSTNARIATLKYEINDLRILAESAEKEKRKYIIEQRKARKILRATAAQEMNEDNFVIYKNELAKQSVAQRYELRDLLKYWSKKIAVLQKELDALEGEINKLKIKRKEFSASIQKQLFEQYNFLNAKDEKKNLQDIFSETALGIPPAAAGECAAPKLLQYAYLNQYIPIAMAEFWWGASPGTAIRKHKQYYPSCQGKCKPILGHMLKGLDVDEDPMLQNPASEKEIKIIHRDADMLVINKPAELLSVPGKTVNDSVYQRIRKQFPEASGPLIVHRLDMSTSGLMLIALNKESNKLLQKQFIERSIKKRYTAVLDGTIEKDKGTIELPLRVDLDDRPRQLVCYEYGKHAKTIWEVIERKNNKTKVNFYPITGRTHQLRVHAAHSRGLNCPIVGDDLYGTKSNRLHLHAEYIEFIHPKSSMKMSFRVKAEF